MGLHIHSTSQPLNYYNGGKEDPSAFKKGLKNTFCCTWFICIVQSATFYALTHMKDDHWDYNTSITYFAATALPNPAVKAHE